MQDRLDTSLTCFLRYIMNKMLVSEICKSFLFMFYVFFFAFMQCNNLFGNGIVPLILN